MRLTLAVSLALLPALSACGSAGGIFGGASSAGSVGAVFARDNETRALVVREAPPGAGAEKAGLQPGDEVMMIEGWYVKDMSAKDIRARLRGDVGSTVRLTILRGDEVHHLRVTRGAIGEHHAAPQREERIAE